MSFPHLFSVPHDVTDDQRRLLILLGAAFFIGQYDMALLTMALPDIQASLAIAEQDIGWLMAIARMGALPAIALTLLADNAGRRRILIVTLVGLAIVATASGLAQNAAQYVLFQSAARLFVTLDEILAITMVLEMLPAARRGWGVGFIAAMGGLGAGLGALLYGAVEILPGGWRSLYVLGGLGIFFVAWLRRNLPESTMYESAQLASSGVGSVTRNPELGDKPDYFAPLRLILKNYRKETVAIAAVAACFWFPLTSGLYFMSKFLQETHSYTPLQISVLFIVAGTAAIFGNVIAGRLSDRYGRRPMLALAISTNCIAFWVFYNTSVSMLLPLAWILVLFSYFSAEVIISAVSGELFPTSCRSTASMLRSIAGVLGAALGLFTESILYEMLGSHAAALSVLLLVALVPLPIIGLLLPETANRTLH